MNERVFVTERILQNIKRNCTITLTYTMKLVVDPQKLVLVRTFNGGVSKRRVVKEWKEKTAEVINREFNNQNWN